MSTDGFLMPTNRPDNRSGQVKVTNKSTLDAYSNATSSNIWLKPETQAEEGGDDEELMWNQNRRATSRTTTSHKQGSTR